ncbi:hypothetical protein BT69DRAFT_322600 [Atractiella rhizophila]|nr:hypothetical protein BT69DRAFT_322600 [Atractiella rhizophila]
MSYRSPSSPRYGISASYNPRLRSSDLYPPAQGSSLLPQASVGASVPRSIPIPRGIGSNSLRTSAGEESEDEQIQYLLQRAGRSSNGGGGGNPQYASGLVGSVGAPVADGFEDQGYGYGYEPEEGMWDLELDGPEQGGVGGGGAGMGSRGSTPPPVRHRRNSTSSFGGLPPPPTMTPVVDFNHPPPRSRSPHVTRGPFMRENNGHVPQSSSYYASSGSPYASSSSRGRSERRVSVSLAEEARRREREQEALDALEIEREERERAEMEMEMERRRREREAAEERERKLRKKAHRKTISHVVPSSGYGSSHHSGSSSSSRPNGGRHQHFSGSSAAPSDYEDLGMREPIYEDAIPAPSSVPIQPPSPAAESLRAHLNNLSISPRQAHSPPSSSSRPTLSNRRASTGIGLSSYFGLNTIPAIPEFDPNDITSGLLDRRYIAEIHFVFRSPQDPLRPFLKTLKTITDVPIHTTLQVSRQPSSITIIFMNRKAVTLRFDQRQLADPNLNIYEQMIIAFGEAMCSGS